MCSSDLAIAEWIDTGGVDSFYSCNFWGIIAEPKVFEHYPVNLTINELSSKDRFELRRRGSIGTGSYFGNFNLQIYADMITTKEITSILRGENELITPRIVGDDGTTTRVAFDLYRFRGAKSDKFEICRIYI